MAIIHRSTITPSKQEVVEAWLDQQAWGGDGPVDLLGGYRFDDPDGEVGVEGLLARRGDLVLHVPLTYRGAPVRGLEAHLVSTMEHSALGPRWIYDASADAVALGCYRRALAGEQEQAVMEVWDGETYVGVREPAVRVHVVAGGPADGEPELLHVVGPPDSGVAASLVATWDGGSGVVAVRRAGR